MTATDQDEAADRFARHIDRLLTPYVPDVSRWDLARRIVADGRAEHWRCVPPAPNVLAAREPGVPAEAHAEDLAAVREACATASDKHHRREIP